MQTFHINYYKECFLLKIFISVTGKFFLLCCSFFLKPCLYTEESRNFTPGNVPRLNFDKSFMF